MVSQVKWSVIEIPKKMQAITYDHFGDADVMQLHEIDVPLPEKNDVLIAVYAAGVNPIDFRLRSGEWKYLLQGGFPRVPGYDVAGTIIQSSKNCDLMIGDRVMAFLDNVRGGGYAQYACCSLSCVAKIPDEMSFEEAAAMPLAGSTALQGLRDHGHIKGGQKVLINGASGGVGLFAVQIAKAYGAIVTGVASNENETFVLSLGADNFIDYEQSDFTYSENVWNIVFDAAGKSSYWKSRPVLADDSYYVSTEPSLQGLATSLMTKLLSKHSEIMLARPDANDLNELIRLYQTKQLRIEIDKLFPLERARDAHRRIEDGVERGKIVIQIPQITN